MDGRAPENSRSSQDGQLIHHEILLSAFIPALQNIMTPTLSEIVHECYSGVARDTVPEQYSREVAAAFGYTNEALDAIPEGSNMGLSCGNPNATAKLRPVRSFSGYYTAPSNVP